MFKVFMEKVGHLENKSTPNTRESIIRTKLSF